MEAAAAAAVHQLVIDTNAAAIDPEHDEMRLDVGAAAARHSMGDAFAESIECSGEPQEHLIWITKQASQQQQHAP